VVGVEDSVQRDLLAVVHGGGRGKNNNTRAAFKVLLKWSMKHVMTFVFESGTA
jgi:hypothetical protein